LAQREALAGDFGYTCSAARPPRAIFGSGPMPRRRATREATMLSLDRILVWIIIGLIGGSVAGLIVRREAKGFGILRNFALGLAGALVGGFLFRLFALLPALDQVTVSLRDVVSAVVGSLIVLAAFWLWQRWRRSA
jgi:uncharacterized membrane protein YeaQ/YmgE (transglycosylase-associated protein family)